MIKNYEIIELREKYNMSQKDLAKAIFFSPSALCKIEQGLNSVNLETLEKIANVFGHTVELTLKEKKNNHRDYKFFSSKKSYEDIVNMDKEDLVDYIFITKENDVIANICKVNKSVIDNLGLSTIKDLLKQTIYSIDNSLVYYMLNNIHEDVELDISILIEDILNYLKDNESIPDDIVEKTCYIDFDLYRANDGNWESDKMRLLDKDKNDLGVNHQDIMKYGEIPLFSSPQTMDLFYYIEENPILQLHY